MSRNHRNITRTDFKADLLNGHGQVPAAVDEPHSTAAEGSVIEPTPEHNCERHENAQATNDDGKLFLDSLALFYLKLQSKHLIPAYVIQIIIDEFQVCLELDRTYFFHGLKTKLTAENNDSEKADSIIKEAAKQNLFSRCHEGFLRSNHSRKAYYKECFSFVKPVQLHLGTNQNNKSCYIHYVSILETLKVLLKDQSFIDQYENPQLNDAGFLTDITDGNVFKSNELFASDKSALKLILYQDSFEVVNPLVQEMNHF